MSKLVWIVGVDEVGRGPIAGPVAVCACMMRLSLYKKIKWKGLTDSKKMTEKHRVAWYTEAVRLKEKGDLSYSVSFISSDVIDRKGIVVAIEQALRKSITIAADTKRSIVLLDGGLRAPSIFSHQQTIIKGDQKEKIISLASVIAKVSRDKKMKQLHKKYPVYEWGRNKGYGTSAHYRALKEYGHSPLHRKSFLHSLEKLEKEY